MPASILALLDLDRLDFGENQPWYSIGSPATSTYVDTSSSGDAPSVIPAEAGRSGIVEVGLVVTEHLWSFLHQFMEEVLHPFMCAGNFVPPFLGGRRHDMMHGVVRLCRRKSHPDTLEAPSRRFEVPLRSLDGSEPDLKWEPPRPQKG